MKLVFCLLGISLISLGISGGLAFYETHHDHWGWFLFASVIFSFIALDCFKNLD